MKTYFIIPFILSSLNCAYRPLVPNQKDNLSPNAPEKIAYITPNPISLTDLPERAHPTAASYYEEIAEHAEIAIEQIETFKGKSDFTDDLRNSLRTAFTEDLESFVSPGRRKICSVSSKAHDLLYEQYHLLAGYALQNNGSYMKIKEVPQKEQDAFLKKAHNIRREDVKDSKHCNFHPERFYDFSKD